MQIRGAIINCGQQNKHKASIMFPGGGGGVANTAIPLEKLANTEIPCRKSTKYRYRIHDRSRLLKAVSISRVCLPQAFMHQKSTSDIARKREKTLIGTTIKKPGHWMPFQFCHRLYNHLPLSLKP